jgi:hypothetical protein
MNTNSAVIPAKAGIQTAGRRSAAGWMPAFAGMTDAPNEQSIGDHPCLSVFIRGRFETLYGFQRNCSASSGVM